MAMPVPMEIADSRPRRAAFFDVLVGTKRISLANSGISPPLPASIFLRLTGISTRLSELPTDRRILALEEAAARSLPHGDGRFRQG